MAAAADLQDHSEGGLGTLRQLAGGWGFAAAAVALAFSLFHLWTAWFGALQGSQQPVVHLGFALVLAFLLRPFGRGGPMRRPSVVDLLWIAGSVAATAYLVLEDDTLPSRLGLVYPIDIVYACILTGAVLEATRRLMGWELAGFAVASIVYALVGPWLPALVSHQGFGLDQISSVLFLTTEGIYGDALQVSAGFIILFTILAALMHEGGAGQFFSNLAYGLFGRVRGGPAKVTVAGSCLFGMISGSAVANVAAVGTFTIPLMKRTGFPPHFAGAVEAVGSTGGQFMPPIMASAAFIIAEILGIGYFEVAAGAAIPALLYYLSLFVTVDLYAARHGLLGLPASELPRPLAVLRRGGHLFLIPGALIWFMAVQGLTPGKSAVFSIAIAVVLLVLDVIVRLPAAARAAPFAWLAGGMAVIVAVRLAAGSEAAVMAAGALIALLVLLARGGEASAAGRLAHLAVRLGTALRAGAIGMLEVALSCACAGIVIGMLMLTGLGLRLSGVIVDLSGGNLPILLVYTMIASLVLGLGLPTVAAYVVLAVLVAPAMTQLGVPALAAHLFVFYFGIISAITPPVALASFTAAAIAGADPMRTSWVSMRLGFAAYVVPFFMVYNPALIMKGTWPMIALSAATASLGVAAVAAALEGAWLAPMRAWERVLLGLAGLALIDMRWETFAVGTLCAALVLASQIRSRRLAPAPATR
ncbi:MAG: TRAP transporter fused permease subunit [Alphaproteobacteria bacterium]|nr:TRAP transporter fused permease subunit [Alphaproteobacteria bacterium]